MTRREATGLILGGCGLRWLPPPFSAIVVEPQDSPRSRLEATLERVRRQHQLPGLAAAVANDQGTIVRGVAGIRRWGSDSRLELEDRFHIASCTKSWTATLAAIAIKRGQLDWTTTLADGLPTLRSRMRDEYKAVSLEQLLAHEGKLPAYTQPSPDRVAWMQALSGSSAEQRLAFLAEVLTESPNHAAGDGAYSNAGYAAAGALLDTATGSTWEELVGHELARPLGLTTVGFGYPATRERPDQPRGHSLSNGTLTELPLDEARQLAVCLWPAGAIHCSIGDLAKYATDHLKGLRGLPALLPPDSYQLLHRRRDGSVFTLGWGAGRDERWGETRFGAGSGGWFLVRIVLLPEKNTAVVMASNSGNANQATRQLWPDLVQQFATG